MSQTLTSASAANQLKYLSEDEQLFRDTVRQFARETITPLVHEMDEHQKMDAGLIRQLFELGLMGIEIPEQYGGPALFLKRFLLWKKSPVSILPSACWWMCRIRYA